MKRTKVLLRLLAVMAVLAAVLVPAVAFAVPLDPNQGSCEGQVYNPANPDPTHVRYGSFTPMNADGYLVVDLSAATSGRVVIWDGTVPPSATGALITGSGFDDIICGTDWDDIIAGKGGNDHIYGGGSAGTYDPVMKHPAVPLTGPVFGDLLKGNGGDDQIYNASGGPLVAVVGPPPMLWPYPNGGGIKSANLKGGAGNDQLNTGAAVADWARGNNGDDLLLGFGTFDTLLGNNGDDSLLTFGSGEFASGGKGDDFLQPRRTAAAVVSWHSGDLGDDTFSMGRAALANQIADGGPGNDTIAPYAVNLSVYWAYGGAGDDTVTGSPGVDFLFGDYAAVATGGFPAGWVEPISTVVTGADTVSGGTGLDLLFGGPGNDTLFGNRANPISGFDVPDTVSDIMTGNSGSDTYFGDPSCTDAALGGDFGTDLGPTFAVNGDLDTAYWLDVTSLLIDTFVGTC